MNKETVPTDFTLSLVITDAIPVILFSMNMLLIANKYHSMLFLSGALICAIAGILKVLWKLIVVVNSKNIWSLFIQMRYLMPLGFMLMILSLVINNGFTLLMKVIFYKPSCYLFLAGFLLMCLMVVFAVKLDGSKSKNNWIEQSTNALAQLLFLIGVILL